MQPHGLLDLLDGTAPPEEEARAELAPSHVSMVALAAEHLVAADILFRGFNCSIAASGLKYDLIAEIGGCLRRVQVKMTQAPRVNNGYSRYRFWAGSSGRSRWQGDRFKERKRFSDYAGHIDLFAFVISDKRKIRYVLPDDMNASAMEFRGSFFSDEQCDLSWTCALHALGGV